MQHSKQQTEHQEFYHNICDATTSDYLLAITRVLNGDAKDDVKMALIRNCINSYVAKQGHDIVINNFKHAMAVANTLYYDNKTNKCACSGNSCATTDTSDINITVNLTNRDKRIDKTTIPPVPPSDLVEAVKMIVGDK
jgi:hypothetical protein